MIVMAGYCGGVMVVMMRCLMMMLQYVKVTERIMKMMHHVKTM